MESESAREPRMIITQQILDELTAQAKVDSPGQSLASAQDEFGYEERV